jgi:alpha-amylase
MLNIMLCFHIHQPFRLGAVSFFERGACRALFDDRLNRSLLLRTAMNCYIPASNMLLGLVDRYGNDFKTAISMTGTALEQMKRWSRSSLLQFHRMARSGSVQFLGETYHHSLFSLYDREEFLDQVRLHVDAMEEEFGTGPAVFRNTELLYEDRVSDYLSSAEQFEVILCEDAVSGEASEAVPCLSYNGLHRLLLRNHRLSDIIAFRFGDRSWTEYPLHAGRFVDWLEELIAEGGTGDDAHLLLYIDYETIGEHLPENTGIFRFFETLTEIILEHARLKLIWPSEAVVQNPVKVTVTAPVSWADSTKDLSAWLGNDMQKNAMETLLRVLERVKRCGDEKLLGSVRKLSSSDHFYYMYTGERGCDADVHSRFSPYRSPQEAYVRYLNAVTAIEIRLAGRP